MTIKLIAIDIDGTLLTDNRKLLLETKAAIRKAKNAGTKIALVTGRPMTSTIPYLKELGLYNKSDEYVSTFHGAVVSTTNGKIVAKNTLNFKDFTDIEMFSRTANNGNSVFTMFQTPNDIYTTYPDINLYATFESFKNKLPIHYRSLHELTQISNNLDILKIMLVANKKILDDIQNNLPSDIPNRLSVIRSEPYYLDFIKSGVNKGWAIKQIANKLHIASKDIAAIGNADNDISMIKFAGIGIAMQNSTERLLNAASLITDTNNNNGVGKAINKILNQ